MYYYIIVNMPLLEKHKQAAQLWQTRKADW